MSGVIAQYVVVWIVHLCVAGAVLGCLYHLTAVILVLRFPRGRKEAAAPFPPVTILRPLHGNEPGLSSRLLGLCQQHYPGRVDVICGVRDESDPAVGVVRLLQAANPSSVELKIDGSQHGSNGKVSNLINMQPAAAQEVVVITDSDIVVDPHYVGSLVAELQEPSVGAVTCAYHGIAAGGIFAQLSAMSINLQFLPSVVTAVSLNAAHPCFGATVALHRDVLARIGGFRAFANELADDYAIGGAVRALGRRVIVSRFTVGHVCFEHEFRALWARQLRAARTIQSIDPVGYAGTISMHPLPLAVFAALSGASGSFLLVGAAVICRLALCWAVQRAFTIGSQRYWLIPVHDAIAFAIFVTSFFGREVKWRGKSYSVADGVLTQVAAKNAVVSSELRAKQESHIRT
jgi:ceramide glucosyltransferase